MAGIQTTGWDATYSPEWAVDYHDREHNLPGGARLDPAAFPYTGQYTAKANGAAAAGATSITVDPLPADIQIGQVLDWTGTGELSRVTAKALKGAVTISVEALDAGVEDNDEAGYGNVRKTVRGGTIVGRTNAERDASAGFGPAADADDEVFITIFTVFDANINPDVELYRRGGGVKVNLLPAYAAASSAIKTKLDAKYEMVRGNTV